MEGGSVPLARHVLRTKSRCASRGVAPRVKRRALGSTVTSPRNQMANDFLSTIKPLFQFLTERGYKLLAEEDSPSFDNGLLIFQSLHLRIQVVRDRGQVLLTARSPVDHRDYDEDILRLLLAGAPRYSRPAVPSDFKASTAAAFLRQNIQQIEGLFAPGAAEETLRRGDLLKNDRADVLFGRPPQT